MYVCIAQVMMMIFSYVARSATISRAVNSSLAFDKSIHLSEQDFNLSLFSGFSDD